MQDFSTKICINNDILIYMSKIHHLSSDVIAKIAAGEVIERPAYAVKELLENALDAGADTITVDVEDAGLKKIIVIDNGHGMSLEDLQESYKLHTTSKITIEEELSHISSFGFRGEALASIAAISHVTLQSKTKDKTEGTRIELLDGEIVSSSPIGMPQGTMITVANMFHSVPGRKKFLKSKQTEFRHIVDVVTAFALTHPDVHFSLLHNKKTIFDLHKATFKERTKRLLGNTLANELVPLSFQDEYISLSGFITKPHAIGQNKKQYLFINKRPVTDVRISAVIKDAYGTVIDPKSFPMFVLSIDLPYEFVDSNVHPRKEMVRFVDTNRVYESLHKAVMQTLVSNNSMYYIENEGVLLKDASHTSWKTGTTKSFAGKLLKENQIPWDIRPIEEVTPKEVMQIHNVYLLTQTKFGLAFVDQHAAHERILYEQFLEAFKKEKKETASYHFAKPVLFDCSFTETEIIKEHIDMLQKLGLEIEHFTDNSFLLHAMPLLFRDRDPKKLLFELLEDIKQNKKVTDIDRESHRMIAYLACRAAVKAGESLTKKQCKDLLEKLEATPNNTNCPHGRPTKVLIDLDKLHRMFKRK